MFSHRLRGRVFAAILIAAALLITLGYSPVLAHPQQDAVGIERQTPLSDVPPSALSATAGLTTSLPALDPLFVPRFEVEGTVRALAVPTKTKE